jgi:hypothetical protein
MTRQRSAWTHLRRRRSARLDSSPRVGQVSAPTSTTIDDRSSAERDEWATAGEIASGLDRARVALSLACDPPSPPTFKKADVVERVEASPRTVLGVLTTMVDDGWLLARDRGGAARRYAGSPALVGEPAGEVRAVLPSDRSDSVTLGTVADRLDTDRRTAYAALHTTPAASRRSSYRGGGWHLLDL